MAKKGSRSRKANGQADKDDGDKKVAGKGHNVKFTKSAIRGYASKYNEILDEKERVNGSFMSKAKDLLEKAANETGLTRSVLRTALAENRREKKRKEEEKNYDSERLEHLNTLRDVLGTYADTPLGRAALAAEEGQQESAQTEL